MANNLHPFTLIMTSVHGVRRELPDLDMIVIRAESGLVYLSTEGKHLGSVRNDKIPLEVLQEIRIVPKR